ncbi:transcriptional regulator [Sphingomonas koreensis]|nr:transcriptional regulator [Sphingomonas koreensis]
MELEKVTNRAGGSTKRWYDDACGTALALELVGERWALLVVRELMFGPRRFGEIKVQLGGISANVLTQRLEGLIAARIVAKRKLPSPASVQVYELTDWGRESTPIFDAMVRWALKSRAHDPSLSLSPASLMMSMRALFDASASGNFAAVAGFRFADDGFVMRVADRTVTVARSDPAAGDFVLAGAPGGLIRVIYGRRPIADAEADHILTLEGDRGLAARFVTLFPLPAKIDAP